MSRTAFTNINHYNPCFWTALWNTAYFDAYRAGDTAGKESRKQVVYALNLRCDKILETTVECVHYQKGLGIAEITAESAKAYVSRAFPDELHEWVKVLNENPETVYLDFEDLLSGMEGQHAYLALMKASMRGGLESAEHKGFICCFLVLHAMRSYEL